MSINKNIDSSIWACHNRMLLNYQISNYTTEYTVHPMYLSANIISSRLNKIQYLKQKYVQMAYLLYIQFINIYYQFLLLFTAAVWGVGQLQCLLQIPAHWTHQVRTIAVVLSHPSDELQTYFSTSYVLHGWCSHSGINCLHQPEGREDRQGLSPADWCSADTLIQSCAELKERNWECELNLKQF